MIYEVMMALMILQVTGEFLFYDEKERKAAPVSRERDAGRHSVIMTLQTHLISVSLPC